MKLLNLTLNESIGEVYHFSPIINAISILESGHFLLTPALKHIERSIHQAVGVKDKHNSFFLSTTRSRVGEYHKDKRNGVLFTLDVDALKTFGQLKSVVYYRDEMEERLITSRPDIPVKGIIKAAKIVLQSDMTEQIGDKVRKLVILLKKLGVPVTFSSSDKKSVGVWAKNYKETSSVPDGVKTARLQPVRKQRPESRDSFMHILSFLLTTKLPYDKLPPEARRAMSRYFTYRNDISVLASEMHNASMISFNNHTSETSKVHKLMLTLHKLNIKEPAQIFDYVKDKFNF